jgi:hypothetical protein
MKKPVNQHVVPHTGGWAVRSAGADRVRKTFGTKQEATDYGRQVARKEKVELVIHGKDGRIQDSDSSGNDPSPPHDRVH